MVNTMPFSYYSKDAVAIYANLPFIYGSVSSIFYLIRFSFMGEIRFYILNQHYGEEKLSARSF